jgi:hypothetical protein
MPSYDEEGGDVTCSHTVKEEKLGIWAIKLTTTEISMTFFFYGRMCTVHRAIPTRPPAPSN